MSKRFGGYSITDIMDMGIEEFSNLTKPQLREAVSRLASAANKRLRRVSKDDIVSPAQIEAEESGGKFSTRGKSEIELQVEFRRVSNFLRDKTSTVTGARQLEQDVREELKRRYGIGIDKSNFRDMLKTFKSLYDESPSTQARKLRYGKLKDFDIEIDNSSIDLQTLSDMVASVLNRYYVAGGSQYEGVAKYFGFE